MSLTVLYITGWCRSGSTVLGNVLAEVPGVVHVGELRFLWLNGVCGKGSNSQCGCGRALTECTLWAEVLRAVCPQGRTLAGHARDVVSWQGACRTRHTRGVLRRPPANPWPDTLAATYRAIADQTGARVIVDSSKFASDAALLAHLPGITPAYVHLIRDPRAVAWSWLAPKRYTGRRGALNSTWHWTGFNLAAEAVSRTRAGASLTMRYEDLTRHPRAAVGAVLDLIGRCGGLDDALAGDAGDRLGGGDAGTGVNPVDADGTVELGGNHTVTGNPNRFERGRTALIEDLRWPARLSARDRALTTALALPLMRRYGYARRP